MEAIVEYTTSSLPAPRVASPHDTVLNSECVYTFHTPFTTNKGILVNLHTFVGMAESMVEQDGLHVRIVKVRREKEIPAGEDMTKVTKLGVGVQGGFQSEDDKFEVVTTHSVVLWKGGSQVVAEVPYNEETKSSFPESVTKSVDSIIHHVGFAVQQDVKVWELDDEPKPVSKYAKDLPFVDNGIKISPVPSDWKCEKSGAMENLWLNLSDGYIGGGRRNWDGSGGSNGALDHFEETGQKYPLVVKLGTITADIDTADCFSYAKDEDGPVKIPNLAELLEKRGINVAGMQKTAKSTAELEVELNATYAFDAITESGSKLVPVSGPGLQGLQNLGNSCYMNSVVQVLLGGTVAELASRYGGKDVTTNLLLKSAPSPSAAQTDVLCQTAKVASALTSGAFAAPIVTEEPMEGTGAPVSHSTDPKYRLAPRMFKNAVGGDHVDFRTAQQQDAAQFLQHMLEKMDRAELGSGGRVAASDGKVAVSSNLFGFKTLNRMVCAEDAKVKYMESVPEIMLSLRIPMETATKVVREANLAPDKKRQKADDGGSNGTGSGETKDDGKEEISVVSFAACLEKWASVASLEDYRWPHLGNRIAAGSTRQVRFANFPRYLIVHLQRYELGPDWTPRKLEVEIDVPRELDLTPLRASGPQDGEQLVPDEGEGGSSAPAPAPVAGPTINATALSQLMDMGFTENASKRSLKAVGGSDVEAATTWAFEHNMDPDFNDPLPDEGASASVSSGDDGVDDAVTMSLVEQLGCFTFDQVKAALKSTNGAADRAADWLFSHMDDLDGAIAALEASGSRSAGAAPAAASAEVEDGEGKYELVAMVSHIGKNTGSGHYVVHIKKAVEGDEDRKWVIFNDESVAKSESPPFQHAYMYFFQRKDTVGAPNGKY